MNPISTLFFLSSESLFLWGCLYSWSYSILCLTGTVSVYLGLGFPYCHHGWNTKVKKAMWAFKIHHYNCKMFSLIILFLRFTHILECIVVRFILVLLISILWIYHSDFKHSIVNGHMGFHFFWFCYLSKAAVNLPVQTLYGYIKVLFQGKLLKVYSRAKVQMPNRGSR